MTELRDPQPLSRVELVVLGRLTAARGATETEIVKSLREIGMPLAESALTDSVTAALASLGSRALVAGPPAPRQPAPESESKSKRRKSPPKAKKPPVARFKLTESGRLALIDALGLAAAPTWKEMCDRIVPALALGEQPGSEAAAAALRSADAMTATLLRRDRSLGEVANVTELCDRIIARALGMPPGPVTPAGIRAHVLTMHCGVNSKPSIEAIAAKFVPVPRGTRTIKKGAKSGNRMTPDAVLNAVGKDLAETHFGIDKAKATTAAAARRAITQSLQRRWLSQQDESDDAQRPSTLRSSPVQPPRMTAELSPGAPFSSVPDGAEALLNAVRRAIRMVGSDGRYGEDNVFVSALWQQVARDQRLSELSLDGFKRWLVTANRNQQLALARADMVDDMDARLVEASEIKHLGATFHFVLDRRDSSSAPWQVHHGR